MIPYLCCLFMQDNCGHWPKGLLYMEIFITLFCRYAVSHINITFDTYNLLYYINFSFC